MKVHGIMDQDKTSKSKEEGMEENVESDLDQVYIQKPETACTSENQEGMDIDMVEENRCTAAKNDMVSERNDESHINSKCNTSNGNKIPIEGDHSNQPLVTTSSILSAESLTSQDNIPSSSNDTNSREPSKDQNKGKGSTSKDQVNESTVENTPKFHKLKSKVKRRNYRKKKNSTGDATGDSCNESAGNHSETRQEINDSPNTRGSANRECGAEMNSDGPEEEDAAEDDSDEWTTSSGEEMDDEKEDEEDDEIPSSLKKQKPKPNFFILPELISREIGKNPLFRRRYYGSLHVVQHFELMHNLTEHTGSVNALNFNRKGNLLASGSDDLHVVVWDWATGKKHQSFVSGHTNDIFQAKWLPFDVENLIATCGRDGNVRLLDLVPGTSLKIASHHEPVHKLAVHPDRPYLIISAGEDARVLSIDIRSHKKNKLLVVKDDSTEVQLYSVHCNPLNSNEFCVAGRSRTVRIYDLRKVSKPIQKLCPAHLAGNKHVHVTCAVYNYNGTEVLASYSNKNIYLFDTVASQPGDFAHRYQGHRNNDSVKGVNFFGPKSEFVISGSDCGNIFMWEKNTEAIVNWMAGDEQGIVNCLEPHPLVPVLATSGLDCDVKIWIPSCETLPDMKDLESCVEKNATIREQSPHQYGFNRHMLWVLFGDDWRTQNSFMQLRALRGIRDRHNYDDESSNDTDSSEPSEHNESRYNSVGRRFRRLQCPPS